MPENTITLSRGRNKHGHRSITERKRRFRCPSVPRGKKIKIGNIQTSSNIGRCLPCKCNMAPSLGARIDDKNSVKNYLTKCAKSNYNTNEL
jgi:hypothetical protein